MTNKQARALARAMRECGASFSDISREIGREIPKSTLSYWTRGVSISSAIRQKLRARQTAHLKGAREIARQVKVARREARVVDVRNAHRHLEDLLHVPDTAKIALAMLYLGEGGKGRRSALMFGNANPKIIALFLSLLRESFPIDERKFRCTVQARADSNLIRLQTYWSKVTGIPLKQFYRARIDKRTIDKPTRKKDYMGVCRIDYFSADVFTTLVQMMDILCAGR